MKKIYFALIALFVAFTFSGSLLAEDKPYAQKEDFELKKEEAVQRIGEFDAKIKELNDALKKIDEDNVKLKAELEKTIKDLKDCQESIYKMLGATTADVEKFRQALGQVEGKIRAKQKLNQEQLSQVKAELYSIQKELIDIRANKISIHPDFYNKIVGLTKDLNALIISAESYVDTKNQSYTVGTWAKDRDCLWNIAAKSDIYTDPLKWAKIWQANTSIIKNPDIIKPGQVLTIPPKGDKTPDEIKAERKYWRSKRAIESKKVEEAAGKKGE